MTILLTNSAGGKKEPFVPIKEGAVGLYSCGPTVYNYSHIGNLRAYVFVDILKRTLLANNFNVNHVMNITDVGHLSDDGDEGEDKMGKGAAREKKTVWEVAEFYTRAFKNDLSRMEIIPPNIFAKATDHIPDMIDMIETLEKKGYTYQAEGNVYFKTLAFPSYGDVFKTHQSIGSSVARVEHDPHKESPFDFVLWFTRHKYNNHAMEWSSPWGVGFPGWHIECSAMASKYLGNHFDIHTGGADHIPIHHTNEVAQSEACFGHKWVNYWLHNEFLTVKGGAKMAKSGEDFLCLQLLVDKGFDPLDYRYLLLGSHYRKQIAFSFEALEGARNSLNRLKEKISLFISLEPSSDSMPADETNTYRQDFLSAINDDLNTPQALAIMWEMIGDPTISSRMKKELVTFFDSVLGLNLLENKVEEIPAEIIELAEQRIAARGRGEWALADSLREKIADSGYEIRDAGGSYTIVKSVR